MNKTNPRCWNSGEPLGEGFLKIVLFLAVLVLCCCLGFSLVGTKGLRSSCRVQASHFSGFSCCEARARGARASVVAAPGL